MIYEYDIYYRQDCMIPLIFGGLVCAFMLKVGWKFIKNFPAKNSIEYIKENIGSCIFFIVCLFLITINLIHLFRGGIYLLTEKEEDALIITGVIENTIEIDPLTGSKYGTENNSGNGEALIINGTKYYVMSYGDLKVGDTVSAKILPKSKFILEINRNISN